MTFSLFFSILCCFACIRPLSGSPPYYLGCFDDLPNRDLPQVDVRLASTTNDKCIVHCKALGYLFAGSQDGQYCMCGNDYGKYGNKFPSMDFLCSANCAGNSSQKCGGTYENSIYIAQTLVYQGCFLFSSLIVPNTGAAVASSSLGACVHTCFAFNKSVIVMQGQSTCNCANDTGVLANLTAAATCSSLCMNGKPGSYCSSAMTEIAVYSLQVSPATWPYNAGVIPAAENGYFYVGCLPSSAEMVERDLLYLSGSVNLCVAYCKARGYLFSGNWYYSRCKCANTYGVSVSKVPLAETACTYVCYYNNSLLCGSATTDSIYIAKDMHQVGCFQRPEAGIVWYSASQTVISLGHCVSYCHGLDLPIIFMSNETSCYCDGNYSRLSGLSQLTNAQCNSSCPTSPVGSCGGTAAVSVYIVHCTTLCLLYTPVILKLGFLHINVV